MRSARSFRSDRSAVDPHVHRGVRPSVHERRPARAVPKERLDEEVKAAEVVVRSLTLPWASLVGALEKAATQPPGTSP